MPLDNLDALALVFVTYAYPLLTAINLVYGFVRLFRFWQIQREKLILVKAMANFGEAVVLGLFSVFTSTRPYIDASLLRPYARLAWILVLIPLFIALLGETNDIHRITRKRIKALNGGSHGTTNQ